MGGEGPGGSGAILFRDHPPLLRRCKTDDSQVLGKVLRIPGRGPPQATSALTRAAPSIFVSRRVGQPSDQRDVSESPDFSLRQILPMCEVLKKIRLQISSTNCARQAQHHRVRRSGKSQRSPPSHPPLANQPPTSINLFAALPFHRTPHHYLINQNRILRMTGSGFEFPQQDWFSSPVDCEVKSSRTAVNIGYGLVTTCTPPCHPYVTGKKEFFPVLTCQEGAADRFRNPEMETRWPCRPRITYSRLRL